MNFKRFSIFLFIFLSLVLTGCSNSSTNNSQTNSTTSEGQTEYPVKVEDISGEVTIESKPERIVSLAPSVLEILYAIDAEDRIVGRTEYGNYPPEAEKIPSIGGFSDPNVELILDKDPDLIIATDSMSNEVKQQLESSNAKVLIFKADTVANVTDIITSIGLAVDCNDQAESVVENLDNQLLDLEDKLKSNNERKKVFIDLGDYYTIGEDTFLGNELTIIGTENIAANASGDYPVLSVEKIIEANPDVYISLYTPVEQLKVVPGFSDMECFKTNQVFYIDPNSSEADEIQRPGPRIVEGMKVLAKDIYPELFSE